MSERQSVPTSDQPDSQPREVGRRSVLYGMAGLGFGLGAGAAGLAAAGPAAAATSTRVEPLARAATTRTVSLNVADFGAVGDGRKDCTAAIQAALNAARVAQAGGAGNDVVSAKVVFPAGRFRVSKSLRLPPNATLEGVSPSSTYLNATGGFDVIRLAAPTDVQCTVRNLGIVCGGGGGINFSDQTYGPSILGDSRHVIDNVVIVEPGPRFYGLGFAGTECRIDNTTIQRPAGVGLYVGGSDHMLQEVTVGAGTGTRDAVVFDTSNTRAVDLKLFGSTGRFVVKGYRNTILGLEIQDTGRSGAVAIDGHETTLRGLLIDSCENSRGAVLSVSGANSVVQGIVIANRGGAEYTTSYALDATPRGKSQIELQLVGPFRRRAIVQPGHLAGNVVSVNAMGGSVTSSLASGTLTPSPFDASTYLLTSLTGGLTVANPRSSVSRAGAADFWAGMTLSFVLASGGRQSLRFGSQYALAAAPPAITGHVQMSFRYDGTTWRESSRSTT